MVVCVPLLQAETVPSRRPCAGSLDTARQSMRICFCILVLQAQLPAAAGTSLMHVYQQQPVLRPCTEPELITLALLDIDPSSATKVVL
jgi:hypothetical protein